MSKITFRAIIEVVGKPKEHIEGAFQGYLKQLKEDKNYTVVHEEVAESKALPEDEMWSTFAELEIKTDDMRNILNFCFDYMPSQLEIIEPEELTFDDVMLSEMFTDLQARLHSIDMVAKQVKLENEHMVRNMNLLLRNYILVLLTNNNLTSEQLSKLTGVAKEKIEDFLDKLIDDKKVDLKEGTYFILRENGNS